LLHITVSACGIVDLLCLNVSVIFLKGAQLLHAPKRQNFGQFWRPFDRVQNALPSSSRILRAIVLINWQRSEASSLIPVFRQITK